MSQVVDVRGLTVVLPNGNAVLQNADLQLQTGEVVALLGPSGAGKTTLLKGVFSPNELLVKGYKVFASSRSVAVEPAYVPQRGALLDHLDVAGNIELAQVGGGQMPHALPWLQAVDLDPAFAQPGRAISSLSGGQAQRVAVARVLAAGRKVVILDEPSVGLDPLGVRLLARLLVSRAREQQVGIIVITHDLSLAGGAADRILFLDPAQQALVPVIPTWHGPCEHDEPSIRIRRLSELEASVEGMLRGQRPQFGGGPKSMREPLDLAAPFAVAGEAILRSFDQRLMAQSNRVLIGALVQALVRPLLFYAVVGVLLGYTVPFVMAHLSTGLRPGAVLSMVGGTYVMSLAPPLSAIVFAATSGSAINAWLGGLRLGGQVTALEGLGVPSGRYLLSPAWLALALSYLVTVAAFVTAMVLGGYVLFDSYEVPFALGKLTSDFLDCPPHRVAYRSRFFLLVVAYALGIASVVVARANTPKDSSAQVTGAMTSAVMRSTLYVVALELFTLMVLYAGVAE